VIGPLLSAPPPRGELKAAIAALARKVWTHPVTGKDVQFAAATIERWYYKAHNERDDPVGVLQRAVRKDAGKVSVGTKLAEHLRRQYCDHKHWTYQLHYDNLASAVKADPSLGPLGSYVTIRRFMQANQMLRKRRPPKCRPGESRAARRRENREIRSYESEYVGSLWHLDFHHGSRPVITERGLWETPIALGILDDHARVCGHLQWYLSESTEELSHGFSQSIQKWGLPRGAMSDNGPAMISEEFTQGLLSLGIVHEKTLPYSPYQNGKQERLWATLEGRLMEMLDGVQQLTLDFLNRVTQAWVEMEYNRTVHRELGMSPLERFRTAPDVLRPSPSSQALRNAFRRQVTRSQRQSDGTMSLEGVRFEIPSRFRHFRNVVVRYARWDLGNVDLVDPQNGTILSPLSPLNRQANADGRRAVLESDGGPDDDDGDADGGAAAVTPADGPNHPLPPLLQRILDEYSSRGAPPAYLPKKPSDPKGDRS
jgi:transposase InsO family protein